MAGSYRVVSARSAASIKLLSSIEHKLATSAPTSRNTAAGEDIRYLPRPRADQLGLPNEDFWLFDSVRFVTLRFDAADVRIANELIDEPAEVVKRCHWRDVAWHYAIPYRRYVPALRQD